jgi:hypothetical protein
LRTQAIAIASRKSEGESDRGKRADPPTSISRKIVVLLLSWLTHVHARTSQTMGT